MKNSKTATKCLYMFFVAALQEKERAKHSIESSASLYSHLLSGCFFLVFKANYFFSISVVFFLRVCYNSLRENSSRKEATLSCTILTFRLCDLGRLLSH